MTNLGTAHVLVTGDFTQVEKQAANVFDKLNIPIPKKAVAGIAGVGAAVAGIGVELFKIGSQFDDAFDTIRVGTGKTGKQLKALEGNFKDVVKTVPTDFKSASTAITDLNRKLGLTGKPLEKLAEQVLELSRVTHTDLSTNIEAVTGLFKSWQVETGKQGPALDKLFRLSQKTGLGVSEIATQMKTAGPVLRQFGLGFDKSAALLGAFEKGGVNISKVIPGLSFALKTFAKAGEAPGPALQDTFDKIQQLGKGTAATELAIKTFGARAGPQLASAIEEGKVKVGDLLKTMEGGKDTIRGAAADTNDFSEKWTLFKNRVLVWLEPVASRVFGALGDAMDALPGIVDKITNAFDGVKAAFTGATESGTTLGTIITGLGQIFQTMVDAGTVLWNTFGSTIIDTLKGVAKAVEEVIGGIIQTFKGLVEFVSGILTGDWAKAWQGIKDIFGGVWNTIKGELDVILAEIKGAINIGLDAIKAVWEAAWNGFVGFIYSLGSNLHKAADWVIASIVGFIKGLPGALTDVGKWVLAQIVDGLKTVSEALGGIGGWLKNRVDEAIRGVGVAFTAIGRTVLNLIADAWSTITDIPGGILNIGGWLKNRVSDAVQAVGSGFATIGRSIINFIADAWGSVKDVPGVLVDIGGWLKNRIGEAITGAKDAFVKIGSVMIGWIIDGLKGGVNLLIDFINLIIKAIDVIPGVDIHSIKKLARGGVFTGEDVPGFARGGAIHHDVFARGGEIARPMVVVGEEAPTHPEYVIPTNPAYRNRAVGLFGQLGNQLGIPGFASGGVLGIDLPSVGGLPSWIVGTGKYLLEKAGAFIAKQFESVVHFVGGGADVSSLPSIHDLVTMKHMVDFASGIAAQHYPYVYGGGHGSFAPPYDCSGFVSAILHAGNLLGSPITTDGLKVFGEGGDGKWVTIGVRGSTGANAHTMMKIGSSYWESGGGHGAAQDQGWDGNFPIHRHPAGLAQGGILDLELLGKIAAAFGGADKAIAFSAANPTLASIANAFGGADKAVAFSKAVAAQGWLPGGESIVSDDSQKVAALAKRVWGATAPLMGAHFPMPLLLLGGKAGSAHPIGTGPTAAYADYSGALNQVHITSDMMKDLLTSTGPMGRSYALNSLVHEFAHAYQDFGLSHNEVEGGADLFAEWASPGIFKKLGISYHGPQYGYPGEDDWLRRHRLPSFWQRWQFRGYNPSGILSGVVGEGPGKLGWGLAQGGVVGPYVGAYRMGGTVPQDGLAMVHRGEVITPAGQGPVMYADVYIGGEKIDERVEVKIRASNRKTEQRMRAGVAVG